MLWAPDVETVPDAVALLQIRRAWPPTALESAKTCPELAANASDSPAMVEMAEACRGLLARPPLIDLWDGISAHDLA